MPLNPSDNPVFSSQLPKLDENSTAHADTWNQVHQPLLNNDVYLRNAIQAVSQGLGGKVQGLDSRLHGVEASSALSVQSAVNLSWLYGGNALRFELWAPGYTLIDMEPLKVIQGVNGDDSLDVESTANIRAGEYYVLTDSTVAGASALVLVLTVLSATRIRLASNMARDWGATAKLVRSSLNVVGARNASAVPGDIYLTRSINIGTDLAGGAAVIRRTLNSGLARLYYRDGYQTAWKECGWSQRRTGGDVPSGFADYEYILPMRGDGWLRLDIQGEPMTITHIAALGQATGLGGFINPDLRPNVPLLSAPAAAATGVMERPTLAIAGYTTPSGNAQDGIQFQLSTAAAFAVVLHDSGTLPAGLAYTLPAGVLAAGSTFHWRARVRDVAGLWSDWMTVASFSTAASFVYVVPPSITGPAANATDVPEQPTVSLSAFTVSGGTDTHKSSQVRIRASDGTYGTPVWDSGADTVNKLSMVVPAGKLKAGLSYYLQARQEGTNRGWSEWGAESKISTKSQFANIIGLVMVASGGGGGTWARVDESGAAKVADASYFGSHAVFGGIEGVTIAGQAMVKIPAFYFKRGQVASGTYAGKEAVWISDQPYSGFELHPAFKNAGASLNQFWVGKYQAGWGPTDGQLSSKAGVAPAVSSTFSDLKGSAESRNTNGVSGFGLWSIYQLSAIQTLAMIEMGGTDSQALIGSGRVNESGSANVDDVSVATASWRGIIGLWGNVNQLVDGIRVNSAALLEYWDRNGNKLYQTTNVGYPSNGYSVTMAAGAGAAHRLSDIYWPGVTGSSSSDGSYGDQAFFYPSTSIMVGGMWGNGAAAGLFYINANDYIFGNNSIGTRISKI